VAEVTDLLPHRLVRLHQLGQRAELLRAEHLWLCTGCGTCSSRCPNQVPVAALVDRLKAEAYGAGRAAGASRAERFHALFHHSVRRYGRNHELTLVRRLKSSRELLRELRTGMRLWRRGKLKLRPQRVRDRCAIERIYERARKGNP
jgi:heterodisulfide reductase subunit C